MARVSITIPSTQSTTKRLNRLTGLRRNPVSVLFLSLLCIIVLVFAAGQVSLSARFADFQYWARQIEGGRTVDRELLKRLVNSTDTVGVKIECQSNIVRPFLTILLSYLDQVNPNIDYEEWSRSLQLAEGFVQHALSCSPTDGNLWARYAMIRQVSAEQPEELARIVGNSQRYSPAEENAISARFLLYNRLTDASLLAISKPFERDIKILCSSPAEALRKKLQIPTGRLTKLIKDLSPSCPTIGGMVPSSTIH